MTVKIRKIEARDKKRWGKLWQGYCRFYERDLSGPVTTYTWKRIMDPASPVHAIVAERPRDGVGEALIGWLVRETKHRKWSRLYWNTKENNYRARGLYDKYTPHSGFLRYVVAND